MFGPGSAGARKTRREDAAATTTTTGGGTSMGDGRRRCARRLECVSLVSLQQEVSMYLDATANDPATIVAGASSGAAAVDAALLEALGVLRDCWNFSGRPGDAYVPLRALSPVAANLLLTYGHHTAAPATGYVVLRDGEEGLVQAGALFAVLRAILLARARAAARAARRQKHSHGHRRLTGASPPRTSPHSSPFHSYNLHHGSAGGSPASTQPYVSPLALTEETSLGSVDGHGAPPPSTPPLPVSRLALLNCRSFGWVDSIGSDDYERSARTLQRVSQGLTALVHDSAYEGVGRPAGPADGRARMGCDPVWVTEAATVVLLSDAVLLDGGVPALALHGNSTVHTAHHQYGRGLACLIPVRGPWRPAVDSRGFFVSQPQPQPAPAMLPPSGGGGGGAPHAANEESPVPSALTPAAAPPTIEALPSAVAEAEEEATMERRFHSAARGLSPVLGRQPQSLFAATDTAALRPVSCGHRAAPGVAAQAVLVGPSGPLVLHVQFDPRTCDAAANAAAAPGGVPAVLAAALTAAAHCATTPRTPANSVAHTPASGRSSCNSPLAPVGGTDSVAAAVAAVCEWALTQLRSPQAALLVEWHLHSGGGRPHPHGTADGSGIFRLLETYAAVAPGADSDTGALVHDTIRRFARWPAPAMPQPDGAVRPLIFARGLELAPEGERMISDDAVVATLQYRSLP